MVTNTKKKAIYKSALAVLLGGTMLTGCGNSEESTKDKEEVTESNKTTEANVENNLTEKTCHSVKPDIMSAEETNALTEGQMIPAEECTKLPDEATLEARDLTAAYVYTMIIPTESGTDQMEIIMPATVEAVNQITARADEFIFKGVQIFKVENYFYFEDMGTWGKTVVFNGEEGSMGEVVSEAKLKELNGNQ